MRVSEFGFDLPAELIAQKPLDRRDGSRMLVLDRAAGRWEDRHFRDLPEYLQAGDRLVVNNTRVLAARLFGHRAGVHATTSRNQISGLVEVLLVKQISAEPQRWEALVRPGRKLRAGETVQFPEGLEGTIVERGSYGLRSIEFNAGQDFYAVVDRIGHIPLPPYIKRSDEIGDRERYQTVFASVAGSVAAPTAGLHFTPEMLDDLGRRGAVRVDITLHVGLGTFQPVRTENVEAHSMHPERYEISPQAASELAAARRVVAVGTSCVRTLEHACRQGGGKLASGSGETCLFIYPGFEFQVVQALLTNFHLPESTLLMLVSAFAGRELVLEAYAHAVREGYRFFSYGDCMLVV
ncbi:MAG: tRNA preQ1(34) S-adenosylmethionine ribosyltransferase-isomerase QueA [Bryobacterales bacterium]